MSRRTTLHLLYLTDDGLVSTVVARDGQVARQAFGCPRSDDPAIFQHLQAYRRLPTRLVVDLRDEALETVSLVAKHRHDRTSLARRAIAQRHPDTPFLYVRLERGQRALLAAVTRPAMLSRWLEALHTLEVPLEGVHSAALLWARGAGGVAPDGAPCLLVTSLPSGGLRLTALDDRVPVFSRIAPGASDEEPATLARFITHETARTANYLVEAGRLAEAADRLITIVLAPSRVKAALATALGEGGESRFQVVGFDEWCGAGTFHSAPCPESADELIAAMLRRRAGPNHYAPPHALRHGLYRRARRVIGGLAASTALGGLGLGAWNLSAAADDRDRNASVRARIAMVNEARAATVAMRPPLPASTDFLRELHVLHEQALRAWDPLARLGPVSRVLARFPEIRLTQLAWHASDEPQAAPTFPPPGNDPPGVLRSTPARSATAASETTPVRRESARLPSGHGGVAVLDVVMPPQPGPVAVSLHRVQRLVAELSALPGVRAEVMESLLDTAPNARLEARLTEGASARARDRFRLRLIWRRGESP